jgi:hypothetical protein
MNWLEWMLTGVVMYVEFLAVVLAFLKGANYERFDD